jgi:hypothetical protein
MPDRCYALSPFFSFNYEVVYTSQPGPFAFLFLFVLSADYADVETESALPVFA